MRMQSMGKCSGSVVAGALVVFSLILLYNYWAVSTNNRDLLLKLHTSEHQLLAMAKANEVLESSLDKCRVEKRRAETNVESQVSVQRGLEEDVRDKEKVINSLKTQIQEKKDEEERLRQDLSGVRRGVDEKDTELRESKEKVVSLLAQLAEKEASNQRLESALKAAELRLSQSSKGPPPATSPHQPTKVDDSLAQPVLINDPAVPYPPGWMSPHDRMKKPMVRINQTANLGITGHGGSVIIFDPPNSPRVQARFSVLDPPKPNSPFFRPSRPPPHEQQMNPELALPHPPAPKEKDLEVGGGAGGEVNGEGVGVLPVPGGNNNLDAAEDDGDAGGVKEEGAGQLDDQSPDGALSPKEIKDSKGNNPGVLQPPPAAQPVPLDPVPGQSGQDNREAAHLNSI